MMIGFTGKSDETKAVYCSTDQDDKIDTFSSILLKLLMETVLILKVLRGGLVEGGDIMCFLAGKCPGNFLDACAKAITDFCLEFWYLTISLRQKLFVGLFCIHIMPVIMDRLMGGAYRLLKGRN